MGSVAALLSVRTGYEAAVAAALGSAADAVAVDDADAAVRAIAHLKGDDLGRAGILLGGRPGPTTRAWPGLPAGATYAMDVVECPEQLRPSLARLLWKVAVVEDLDAARRLVRDASDVTAVTTEGDLLGAHFASGGSSSQPSLIEVQAAVDDATERLTAAAHSVERLGFDLATLETERDDARRRVDVALAQAARVRRHPGGGGRGARRSTARRPATPRPRPPASTRPSPPRRSPATTTSAGLTDLESRLTAAEDAPDEEPDTAERERLGDEARTARAAEMEARLAAAHRRGAGPRAARPGRRAAALGPGRARRPRRRDRPTRAAAARGPGRRGRRPRGRRRARPPGGVGRRRRRRAGPRRAGPRRPRAGAARVPRAAARPGPRARRAGQHRAPRRDGPHPAADAHRAARGARAGGARPRRRRPGRRLRPRPAGPVQWRGRRGRGDAGAGALRPRGADQAAAHRRARAGPAGPDQPARAGGVLRAGGAPQVPHRAARGPQAHPQGPARHRPRGRRAGGAGLHRGVRRREQGLRLDVHPAVPRR